MEDYIEINRAGLTKLDNGRHYEYHNNVYDLLHEVDATKIGVPVEKITQYKGGIDVEGQINRESQASLDTQRMQKADEARDRLLSYLFGMIRTNRFSPEAAEAAAAAADELEIVIRPYYGIQKIDVDQESAAIDGLLIDLREAKNTPFLTTLRLTAILPKLEAANADFRKIYKTRTSARADDKELPSAKAARAKTDAVFDRIVFILQAAYYSGASPIERTLIASIVKQINQRTQEIFDKYNQSLAKKKAAKKPKDPTDPKQPKEPKQPKDPKDPKQPKEPKEPKKPDGEKPKDPKQPDEGGKKPENPGDGDGDPDIHLPEE